MSRKRYLQYMYSYPHKTAYRSLHGISLKDYAHLLKGCGHGLYVHIPFCQAKCGYCNLFSVTGQEEEAVDRYLEALKRQSRQYKELVSGAGTEFSELVTGGGTPLYLTHRQLSNLYETVRNDFSFSDSAQSVIETAPNQTDGVKLGILKQHGVTRVSMGIQSFHDSELSALGRRHRAKKAREALELLKKAEFSCINLDFIYAIAGQTAESLLESLRIAAAYEPDELFLYPLYIKHGAGLERTGIVPDEKEAFRQYEHARDYLLSHGFRQDSMRRFVRLDTQEGKQRAFSDCGFQTSLALGCGGRSYLGNLHFCSPYAVTDAECRMRIREFEQTQDYTKISHGFLLSPEEVKRRYIIKHLFTCPGLPLRHYQAVFHSRAAEDFPVLDSWIEKGYVSEHAETDTKKTQDVSEVFLALTETGLGLSDCLGPQLISEPVRQAMEEWEKKHGRTYGTVQGESEKL